MTIHPLSTLLVTARADNPIISWRGTEAIRYDRWKNDVAVAALRLKNTRAGAVLCQDSYNFSIGFFGLLHAGAQVILPPQNHAASLKALKGQYNILIDDAWVKSLAGSTTTLSPLNSTQNTIDVFTSGSTGFPQKISKSLHQLETEIALLEKTWGTEMKGGTIYATVSHQHIYGLTFKVLWPLMAGRAFKAETHLYWEDLITALQPASILISSPAHLSRLEGVLPLKDDFKLKAIYTAGAPLAKKDALDAEVIFGCAPHEIFGSTETGAIATRQPANEDYWRPLPGISIRAEDDQTLSLQSPYAGEGWVKTKDRIELTPQGFHFLGRSDTIVKIEGKRISLAAVEKSLLQLEEVEEAASILLPGVNGRLAAAIKLSPTGQTALKLMGPFNLNRQLRQRLLVTEEATSVPRLWRFVDTLPTQSMGKRRAADIIALFDEAL